MSEKESISAGAKIAVNAVRIMPPAKNLPNKNPRTFRLGKELYMKNLSSTSNRVTSRRSGVEKAMTHKKNYMKKCLRSHHTCGQVI